MKDLTFVGIDVDLEISLFEYNVIVSNEEHKDGSGTHFVIYKIDDDNYGTGHISEKELNNLIEGKDWIKENDIKSFLDYCGTIKGIWLQFSLIEKLESLINYWGYENIMGTDYSPVNKEFVLNKYLKIK